MVDGLSGGSRTLMRAARRPARKPFSASTPLPSRPVPSRTPVALFLLALSLLALLPFAAGKTETSRPSSFSDPGGIAANGTLAYDVDNATAAAIAAGSAGGNVSFSSFSDNANAASVDVKRVGLLFDLAVSGLGDDQWALDYSEDGGATWNPLRALAGGNLSRQTLSYADVAGPGGDWAWPGIAQNLSLRVRYAVNGSPDAGASILLYEAWANVTSDVEPPTVTPLAPGDGTNYSGLTLVNFTYNASDALSGLANCSLYIDGALNKTNTSPVNGSAGAFSVSLDNGRYNWSVACWDNASAPNQGASADRIVMVDNAPPTVMPLSPGDGATLNGSAVVTFSFSHDDLSTIANCTLYLNGTANATISGTDANWPTGEGEFLVQLPNGDWTWNVSCTDAYGRANASAAFSLTQAANDAPVVDDVSLSSPIVPVLGSNVTVGCNATVTDLQGQLTIANVTAYFHRSDWPWDAGDETSGHLTDASCGSTGINATSVLYDCSFPLPYYARNGNWTCTVRVADDQGYIGAGTATTPVEPLYAFNLSPQYIGYGTLDPGAVSGEVPVTVTNLGNAEIDMALDGYALGQGDGLALACDVGNTTIGDERYALSSGIAFGSMAQLTSSPVQVDAFNLPPKNDSFDGQGTIYWRVRLGVPQKGGCSGFVTFTGVQS